jgi:lysophospholipase L1-like esterase
MKFLKIKKWAIALLLTSALTIVQADTVRIMPLGDSITLGMGPLLGNINHNYMSGYRGYLWQNLHNANYDIDFVGSQSDGASIVPSFDTDHEGHSGYTTDNIAAMVYEKLQLNAPDIILLHIGTNDISPYRFVLPSTSVAGVESILDAIDTYENEYHHPVHVVLSSIIKVITFNQSLRKRYNKNVKKLAEQRIANGDNLTFIEMEKDAGLTLFDYADPLHPNRFGYKKIAHVWFDTLEAVLVEVQAR